MAGERLMSRLNNSPVVARGAGVTARAAAAGIVDGL